MDSIFDKLNEYFEKTNTTIENLINNLAETEIDFSELMNKSDQDIEDYLKGKVNDGEDRRKWFLQLSNIKIQSGIKKLEGESEKIAEENLAYEISELFSTMIKPDDVIIEGNTVKLLYNYQTESPLFNKIKILDSWKKENVIETISSKYGVLNENIVFIDSVTTYVEFISSFDDINYVSRGQKDCTYELKPSLYRIYSDNYKSHASDFEDRFKQKVLFYDKDASYKNPEELRAYGQHFGLPTNYLDFTEAHLISLLFSVEEYTYSNNHSIVFFVDALSYNKDTIKSEIKLVDFSDIGQKESIEKSYSDKSYFIKVGNSNERIHFQKGCFLKVVPNDGFELMFKNYTKIAIIDKQSKAKILKELFNLGITLENIYPDKDNMVNTIKFIKSNME